MIWYGYGLLTAGFGWDWASFTMFHPWCDSDCIKLDLIHTQEVKLSQDGFCFILSIPFHNFQGKGSKAKAKLSCSRSSARSWIPPLFSTSDSVSNWVSDAFWLFLGLLFHAVPRGRRFGNSSWRFGCRQHSRKAWPSPARGREPGTPGSEHPVAGRGRWMMLDGHGGDGDIGGCLRSWNYGPSGNIYIYTDIRIIYVYVLLCILYNYNRL